MNEKEQHANLGHRLAKLINDTIRTNRDNPAVKALALEAAELIMAGKVYHYEVEDLEQPGLFHTVQYENTPKEYFCTCQKERVRVVGLGLICKDNLAQHFAYLLNLKLDYPPMPVEGELVYVEGWGR